MIYQLQKKNSSKSFSWLLLLFSLVGSLDAFASAPDCSDLFNSQRMMVHQGKVATVHVEFENDSLIKSYEKLLKLTHGQRRQRVHELYQLTLQVVGLAQDRPIETISQGSVQFTFLNGGFTDMDLSRLGTNQTRQKMVALLHQASIHPEMWVSDHEKMPTHEYFGMTKTIVEYEYLLSAFLKALTSSDSQSGYVAFSAMDRLIRKHQVYLNLNPSLREALDEGFTLASFQSRGIEKPHNYPFSLVGSEVVVELNDLSPQLTLKDHWQKLQKDIAGLGKALEEIESGRTVTKENLPDNPVYRSSSFQLTQSNLKNSIKRLQEDSSQYPKSGGVYRGIIRNVYGAGFDMELVTGEILVVNVNHDMRISGLAIRPLK